MSLYPCPRCSSPFQAKSLSHHLATVHLGRRQSTWVCGTCDFSGHGLSESMTHCLVDGHRLSGLRISGFGQKAYQLLYLAAQCSQTSISCQDKSASRAQTRLEDENSKKKSSPKAETGRKDISKPVISPRIHPLNSTALDESIFADTTASFDETAIIQDAMDSVEMRQTLNELTSEIEAHNGATSDLQSQDGFMLGEESSTATATETSDDLKTALPYSYAKNASFEVSSPTPNDSSFTEKYPAYLAVKTDEQSSSKTPLKPASEPFSRKDVQNESESSRDLSETTHAKREHSSRSQVLPTVNCANCKKEIRYASYNPTPILTQHVVACHEIRPFACSECGESRKQRQQLKAHFKKSPDGIVIIPNQEETEAAVKRALETSFPDHPIKWNGFRKPTSA